MSNNFKIYFKDLEKKVLLKGTFEEFEWISLRDSIITNSKHPEFKSKNKELKNSDYFKLEFIELPKNFQTTPPFICNNNSYNYFKEDLKKFSENNKNVTIKAIKMILVKLDHKPRWDLPKYDVYLQNILENIWKKEEVIIKQKLNNFELSNGRIAFIKKYYKNLNNDDLKKIKNNNIICNSCFSIDFYGPRYICSYCNNINLCKKCYFLGDHNPEHHFILFKQILQDNNINKYNNKFSPCTQIFKNIYDDSFEVSFKIANIGENDLENCYISNIKFTGNYLWSDKNIINKKLSKNENTEIKMKIYFKDNDNKNGLYEGHFRMFNEKGEPFGDILKIRIKN